MQNGSVLFIPSEWQGFLLYAFLFLAIVFFPKGVKLPERKRGLARKIASVDLNASASRAGTKAAAAGEG